jgi:hypothetical protein
MLHRFAILPLPWRLLVPSLIGGDHLRIGEFGRRIEYLARCLGLGLLSDTVL